MIRTAVVTPIPTPYRDPLWAALARRPGIDLHVYYCAAGKADRPWEANWERNYSSEVLPGRNLLAWKGADASCFWNATLGKRFRRRPFDAMIVGGYNHITMWTAMRWARKLRAPYFMMCETWASRSGKRKWWKERGVRAALNGAAAAFPTGVLAERYLAGYGMTADRLVRVPNVPDVVGLAARAEELRSRRPAMRAQHRLDERRVILFCGRLIPKKRAALLVEAFHRAGVADRAQLVIVGDGPERPAVEKLIADLDLSNGVCLAGFAQPQQMPEWYALADLFVLPSSETWGVAALEALASGAPVILSDQVGCHPDVLIDERLGRTVPAGDLESLTSALRVAIAENVSPQVIEQAWRATREAWSYELIAARIAERIAESLFAHARVKRSAAVGMEAP